jgi:pimeloyl-ACP methyl ester carboxylesterase/DNA-binding CsgD family transcriptional regulator
VGAGRIDASAQVLRFCRSRDGVQIAYARHGTGPTLVIATCWLSHLQHDWESPVWRHFLADLGEFATVIRYDERGHGLSDWGVEDHSLEARVGDLEAVVEDAGVDRFALMAMSQGGPVVIDYAVRHPERVSRLLFYGSYATAFIDPTPEQLEMAATLEAMIKVGWARPDSAFRRVFTSMMIPDASEEQMRWLDELQRVSVSAETAVIARQQRSQANVIDLLPSIQVPTLVLQSLRDQMNDFADSRLLATHIRGARLVALDSANHIVLEHEPAWRTFVTEVQAFIEPDRRSMSMPPAASVTGLLSTREAEVLRLAATGLDNDGIAAELVLSVRTVERHLQNAYMKLGVQGKAARTAAVARFLASV